MKKGFFLPWALAILMVIPACSGYQGHLKNWEKYEPTPFYREYAKPSPAKQIAPIPVDRDFEKEVLKLKERKKQWEDSLRVQEKGDGFYRPDPARFRTLLPAGKEPSPAKEALGKDFPLEDLEILALVRNPGVKGAERNLQASLEAYNQVWNLDEILRQYSAFTEGLMTGIGPMEGGEALELKFPFPGVLALKGEIVTQEVAASKEMLEIARRMAITQIRQAYWDLLFTLRAQKITEEMLVRLQHLEAVVRVRYETGKTSFQDMIKTQIQTDKQREELKTLREEQKNFEAKMREILDLPPETKIGFPVARTSQPGVPSLDALYRTALEQRQELKQMRAMIGKMERMIEMAETMIYPPYSLGFALFQDEAIAQVGTMAMKESFPVKVTASTGAGVPRTPWYGTNDAYLRETRQKLAALREDLKKAEDESIFRVREAWFRLDRAKRQEALYAQRVVTLSQAALEVSIRAYEAGNIAFADVIESYISWLNNRLSLERERSNLGIAHSELEEAVGGPWKE
jgi:cobalt-zinc-cadmium efflux system outer membrane protein